MKPSQLAKLIEVSINNGFRRTIHLEASPGLGKTQIGRQIAKQLGIGFKLIHAPLMQPEDYGFPVIQGDRDDVKFVVSKVKFPLEGTDCEEKGILLIDELPQADASTQKILTHVVQEREIHGRSLKPGWIILTTGNRIQDRAGANRLLSHLRNKITTIEVEPALEDWTTWALENDVAPEVIAFIRFRTDLLNHFEPNTEISATPRSWVEGVSDVLKKNLGFEFEYEMFKGAVGEGPAAEFVGFVRIYRELPSPDVIMMSPKTADVPTESNVLYALTMAMAKRVDKKNFGKILEYMSRIPTEYKKKHKRDGGSEYLVLFIRVVLKHCPEVQTTKEFIKWATTDGAKILG